MALPINWPIARNPLNWFIVVTMLLISGFLLDTAAMWHIKNRRSES
jgi:hypothetical protein